MSTEAVLYTVPSNGWTGTVDVTLADLYTNLTVKDFKIYYNGTEQGTTELDKWTKTTRTQLTYSGVSALLQNDVVRIQRKTPLSVIQTVAPFETISSSAWNAEFDRVLRRDEEYEEFGLTVAPTTVSDAVYSSGWNGVTDQAPSKNAVYDKINTIDSTISNLAKPIHHMAGRLTVTSGTPIVGSNASSTTIYYTPYLGDTIYLYNTVSLSWDTHTLTERSLALSGLTDYRPYDLFIYSNAGTLTLESVIWTDTQTRATNLATQNGIYVQSGAANKRYIGTFTPISNTVYQGSTYISASGTAFVNNCTLWNYYNRVQGDLTYNASATSTNFDTDFSIAAASASTYTIGVTEHRNLYFYFTFGSNAAVTNGQNMSFIMNEGRTGSSVAVAYLSTCNDAGSSTRHGGGMAFNYSRTARGGTGIGTLRPHPTVTVGGSDTHNYHAQYVYEY